MSEVSGQPERTVAELEAQRAAEQEALRKVRRLTDELEEEQRSKQRQPKRFLKRTIWVMAVLVCAVIVPSVVYWIYGLTTAQQRMEVTCAAIKPGMSFDALKVFAKRNGLLTPVRQSETVYLAETRSFGRHACKVTLDNGVVRHSEHNYAD